MTRYSELDTNGVSAEDFYLSQITPDQTKEYASLMHREGASDVEIGKMVKHHIHDVGKPDGLKIYEVHARDSNEAYGIVAFVPNEPAYETANELYVEDVGQYFDLSVRLYGMPDDSLSKDIVKSEIIKRGLDPNRVVATKEDAGDNVVTKKKEHSTKVYTFE